MKDLRSRVVLCIIVATLLCAPSVSFGSGFGIFTQGASALGQGAAVVAHNDSPSAIFYNPALINKLPGTELEMGTTLIFPTREFTSAATGLTMSTEDRVFFPSTFYVTHSFNSSLSAGLGVFNPFGLGTTWPSGWEGRYITTKSELTTYDINPVASYRIMPNLSLALGLDIIFLNATLENVVPSAALGVPGPSFDVAQKFKGSGNGIGYNLGLLLDVNDAVSIGASYRSEVKIDADGDLNLSIAPQSFSGKARITLPQQVSASIAYKPNDKWVVETGVRWEDWSSFDQLKIDIAGQPPAVTPRDWRGTLAIDAGGKYHIDGTYSMTAGYLYGWNPVPDSTFEPGIPDSNVHLFCLGGEAQFDRLNFALAYAYQLQYERTKSTNLYGPLANGTYDSHSHLLGLSLSYKF
ncbi:MAG: outer membrane protein transport protein [Syntrophales bacterium LBB04]|nr:outer membrane protein transport protein [Syntrophales bacterium LBB04]